ncbi:MAG: hypothetical protein KF691_15890 [Phycisphaeraceae bacterium]|nr:hypothetical protein [Phycisphaeraceae bacterium]
MSAANKEKRLTGEVLPEEGNSMPGAFAAGLSIGDAHGLSAAPRSRFHTQHVIIFSTLALSVALIYGMRRYGMQSGLKFNTADLSYKRDESQHRRAEGFQRVMAELNAMNKQSTEGVKTNPFKLMGAEAGDARNDLTPRDDSAELARRKAEERTRKLTEELGTLKLGSIMMGRVPLARINDELVRVGDFAGESFKVVEILPLAVTLEADGKKFTLELADESNPKSRPPRAK